MAHLIRTVAFCGWVLLGIRVAPPMGSTALEVAREQLQSEEARAKEQAIHELPEPEVSIPRRDAPSPKRPVSRPPPEPVDASAGVRI